MLTKREISILDKSSLNTHQGWAVILLGPDYPEIKELIDIGWPINRIIGIDRTKENIAAAKNEFKSPIYYNLEFNRFWQTHGKQLQLGYLHLDLCGHFGVNYLNEVISVIDNLLPAARLRITFSVSLARLNKSQGHIFLAEQAISQIRSIAPNIELIDYKYYMSALSHKDIFATVAFERKK